jgi:hypothetical protein
VILLFVAAGIGAVWRLGHSARLWILLGLFRSCCKELDIWGECLGVKVLPLRV